MLSSHWMLTNRLAGSTANSTSSWSGSQVVPAESLDFHVLYCRGKWEAAEVWREVRAAGTEMEDGRMSAGNDAKYAWTAASLTSSSSSMIPSLSSTKVSNNEASNGFLVMACMAMSRMRSVWPAAGSMYCFTMLGSEGVGERRAAWTIWACFGWDTRDCWARAGVKG